MSTPMRFALEKVLARRETVGSSSSLSPRFPLHVPIEELAASDYSGQMSIVSFAHHDYLALDAQPRVRAAVLEALEVHGLSAGAPRRLGGETTIGLALESALAEFVGVTAAAVLPCGGPVMGDLVRHLLIEGGHVLVDAHASDLIRHAARASGAAVVTVTGANPDRLDAAVAALPAKASFLYLAEGIRADGSIVADFAQVIARAKAAGGWVVVDETRTFGILGASGRGAIEELQVDLAHVDLVVGSLGEALVAAGAFVGGSTYVVEALKRCWPPLELGVGLSPALAAAATAALAVLKSQPSRLHRLRRNLAHACDGVTERGMLLTSSEQMPTLVVRCESEQQAHSAALSALEAGFFVPPGSGREGAPCLVMTVTAGHRRAQIDGALDAICKVLRPEPSPVELRRLPRSMRRGRTLPH